MLIHRYDVRFHNLHNSMPRATTYSRHSTFREVVAVDMVNLSPW